MTQPIPADQVTTFVSVPVVVLEKLIEAARTTSYEYLRQAGNYAKLNQPAVEKETYENHYVPIRDAIREAESALA